jgi:hypothetical protein
MKLEAWGCINHGPKPSESSVCISLAAGDIYTHCNIVDLANLGFRGLVLNWNGTSTGTGTGIESVYLEPGKLGNAASIVVFNGGSFDGSFTQFTAAGFGTGFVSATVNDPLSFLLISTPVGGAGQQLLSFKSIFQSDWDTAVDREFAGQASRSGEPILTWDMFPSDEYSFLDSNLYYLKVHQDLSIPIPCWPTSYNAWMEYWIYLYPSGGNLQASVAGYWWWVDGGVWTDKVADKFVPKVQSGMATLENEFNAKLGTLNKAAGGLKQNVYYLPGAQSSFPSNGGRVTGNTEDDVTIVLQF